MAVVVINAATQMVTKANLLAGIYEPTADTIGIPILSTLFASVIFSPWLVLIAFYSRLATVRDYFAAGGTHAALVILGLMVVYLPAIFLAVGGVDYWAIPNHYAIAVAFGLSLFLLFVLLRDDLRALRSNFAPNTDARQERPRAG